MSKGSSSSSSGGIGFFGLLTIVFVTLKLLEVIAWPWVWVLAPTWIPLSLLLVALVLGGAGYLVYRQLKRRRLRPPRRE